MARKKAITDLQEEDQMLESAAPDNEWESGTEPAEDSAGFAEFPSGDELPFDGSSEEDAAQLGDQSKEFCVADESYPELDNIPDGELPQENDSTDYEALLSAAGEGGMEPVPLSDTSPLLLGDTAEAEDSGEDHSMPSPYPTQEPDTDRAAPNPARNRRTTAQQNRILTIDPRAEVQTREDLDDLLWHEIQNAYRTRHILTGKLDSVERTQNGMDAAVILYKGFRVLIPLKEMMVHTGQVPNGPDYPVWVSQVSRILNARQYSDIDFIVRGIDEDNRMVVGSRRDAMLRKRRRFYLETDEQGHHMIEVGRLVQARVVAVAERAVRLEVFGVECAVVSRGSSRMWADSTRYAHYVGELLPVHVTKIDRDSANQIKIQVDPRDVFGDERNDLSRCQVQRRYVGQVTNVNRGVMFVRLDAGVNAIAHTCYDMRMPGKKDTVSFAVTRLDEKNNVAIGIITRIIKQNL